MTLLSRFAKNTGLGAISLIVVGVCGMLLLACIEVPKWFLGNLGRFVLFLLKYNEHRPDLPRSY
jgi:hypothetical protein